MRKGKGEGRWLESIAMVWEELLLCAQYCQGNEVELEVNGVHAVELELVESGN